MDRLSFQPRSQRARWAIGAAILFFLILAGWGQLWTELQDRDFTLPIDITVEGVPASQNGLVTFWTTAKEPQEISRYRSPFRWRIESWCHDLNLAAARLVLPEIRKLRVRVGETVYVFDAAAISKWSRSASRPLSFTAAEPNVSLRIPLKTGGGEFSFINWPEDRSVLGEFLKPLLWLPVLVLVVALFHFALRKATFRRLVEISLLRPVTRNLPWRPGDIAGLVFVAVGLVFLEIRQPFYFTEDDNFAQFLPYIVGGCRSVFSGQLPMWNPWQLMGAPALTLGVYALTYPPTYAAWLISTYLLHNQNLTIDVFALGHLLAGYLLCNRALRGIGLHSPLSALGSASYVLSGFALIFGRSWYYMLPVLVWAPVLMIMFEKLGAGKAGWRWVLGIGVSIGLFFHAGNVQMWMYALMFFLIAAAVSVKAKGLPWRSALWIFPALCLGFAIAAPVLILQKAETANIDRAGGVGASIESAYLHFFLPLGPLVPHPEFWGGYESSPRGEMFYLGFPFALAAAWGIGMITCLVLQYRGAATRIWEVLAENVWLVCAAIALLLALGRPGVIWTIMSSSPGFDKFNVPGKFIGFLCLFVIAGGGLLLQRCWGHRWYVVWALSFVGFGLLAPHLFYARQSFYDYKERPYSRLQYPTSLLAGEGSLQRVLAVAQDRSMISNYSSSLRNNFATLFRIPVIGGYDPLVEARPEDKKVRKRFVAKPFDTAAAYGVRWMLVYRPDWKFDADSKAWPIEIIKPEDRRQMVQIAARSKLVTRTPDYDLYAIPNPAPMAFLEGSEIRALPVSMDWSGVSVDTKGISAGNRVTINVLRRPWLTATGVEQSSDEWGRVVLRLTRPRDSVKLTYSPPWAKGLIATLCLLALCVFSGLLLSRLRTAQYEFSEVLGQYRERVGDVHIL